MNAGRNAAVLAAVASALALSAPAEASVLRVNKAADVVSDDGKCSLREAIQATNVNQSVNGGDDCKHVNGDTGPDLIYLPDKAYAADGAPGDDNNVGGDFDVEAGERLQIRGIGSPTIAGNLDRVIHLESGSLTLSGIAITGGEAGAARGGGILVDGPGKLTLQGGSVEGSSAARGGGIAVDDGAASLALKHASIRDNTADGGTVFDGGGGIYFDGARVKISRAKVQGNSTLNGDGGGMAVRGQDGAFSIRRTLVSDNHADEHAGGGIDYRPLTGKATIVRSLVSQNSANFAGGGIAVGNDPARLVVKTTAISTNSLSSTDDEFIGGGGISNSGTTKLLDSIVAGNGLFSPNAQADGLGAGIRNDNGVEMSIARSLIASNGGNATQAGGGIHTEQPLEVTNSTISGNLAGGGSGGGLSQLGDPVTLSHVTFAENDASGNKDAISGDPGEVTLHASIVDNGPAACDDAVLSTGYNLDAGTSCGLGEPGDLDGTSAKLKPLADNGGPLIGPPGLGATLTYALKKSSPAIDRVPRKKCDDATGKRLRTDQRAVKRPQGKRCDSGAYERK